VLDLLALFRNRRAPRRARRVAPNGGGTWQDGGQDMTLAALDAPAPAARREARKRPRPRPPEREDPEARQEIPDSYLAAHGLKKTYGQRTVVNGGHKWAAMAVSSKPMIPGNSRSPHCSFRTRLSRTSCLTDRGETPARWRSSPSVWMEATMSRSYPNCS